LAGPVKCGAMGQTFLDTCAYDLGSCLFAPNICSLKPWLERREEALIMRAADDGVEVLRRPDASPAAVLGVAIGLISLMLVIGHLEKKRPDTPPR
jgi:hypothetical protein